MSDNRQQTINIIVENSNLTPEEAERYYDRRASQINSSAQNQGMDPDTVLRSEFTPRQAAPTAQVDPGQALYRPYDIDEAKDRLSQEPGSQFIAVEPPSGGGPQPLPSYLAITDGHQSAERDRARSALSEYLDSAGGVDDLTREERLAAIDTVARINGVSRSTAVRHFEALARSMNGDDRQRLTVGEMWRSLVDGAKTGNIMREMAHWGHRLLWGNDEDQLVYGTPLQTFNMQGRNAVERRIEELRELMPVKDPTELHWVRRGLYGAGMQATMIMGPNLIKGATGGMAAAAGGAAIAAVAGVSVPATIIGGLYLAGQSVATMFNSAELTQGLYYLNVRDLEDENGNRVPDHIARSQAKTIGGISAALEMLQPEALPGIGQLMTRLAPRATAATLYRGLNDVVVSQGSRAAADTLSGVMFRAGAKALTETGFEIGVEVAQETMEIWGNEMAKQIANDEHGAQFDPMQVDEYIEQMKNVVVDSALTFGFMGAPGTGVELAQAYRMNQRLSANQSFREKLQEAEEKLEEDRRSFQIPDSSEEARQLIEEDRELVNSVLQRVEDGEEISATEALDVIRAGERIDAVERELQRRGELDLDDTVTHRDFERAESDVYQTPEYVQLRTSVLDPEVREDIRQKFAAASEQEIDAGIFVADLMNQWTGVGLNELLGSRIEFTNDAERFASVAGDVSAETLRTKRGAEKFISAGRMIIYASKKADVTTFIHEVAHAVRPLLDQRILAPFEAAFGVENGLWTARHEELFATGLEEYLRSGRAANEEYRTVFQKIGEWFNRVYAMIRQRWDLKPDLVRAYDQLLSNQSPPEPASPGKIYRSPEGSLVTRDSDGLFEAVRADGAAGASVLYTREGNVYTILSSGIDDPSYLGTTDELMSRFIESADPDARFSLAFADDAARQAFNRVYDRSPNQIVEADERVLFRLQGVGSLMQDAVEDQWSLSQRRISQRIPTGANPTVDHLAEKPSIDIDAIMSTEGTEKKQAAWEKIVDTIRGYDHVPQAIKALEGRDLLEAYRDFVVSNLEHIFEQWSDDLGERSRLWYDGANRIANDWAETYGLPPEAIAGVLAPLSPQKDWYMNVSLAQRVLDIWTQAQDFTWDSSMDDQYASRFLKELKDPDPDDAKAVAKHERALKKREKDLALFEAVKGKKLSELENSTQKALWIRMYDEVYNEPYYRVVSPEGDFLEIKQMDTGAGPQRIAWGSLMEISRAVDVLENPSYENIATSMGSAHKVRNFYNNIIAPKATAGDVTMDTHAIAAALGMPLSGKSREVMDNLQGPPKDANVGVVGLYGVYADAYRVAAEKHGILAREMQSITWEAVRTLFTASWKRDNKNVDAVRAVWKRHADGEITHEQAWEEVESIAGGYGDPAWRSNSEGTQEAGSSSYEGKLSVPIVRRAPRPDGATRRGAGGDAAAAAATQFQGDRHQQLADLRRDLGRSVSPTGKAPSVYASTLGSGDGGSVRLAGRDVRVIDRLSVRPEVAGRLDEAGVATPDFLELEASPEQAQAFHDQIAASKAQNKYGASVYVYDVAEYQQMRTFVTEDGNSGFALKGDDIVSVFTIGRQGTGPTMIQLATQLGGRTLDAFDTVLPDLYHTAGFRVVSRMAWNDEYAPDGWDKQLFSKFNQGEPDVVFMVFDPESYGRYEGASEGVLVDDYDEAVRLQQEAKWTVEKQAAAMQPYEAFSAALREHGNVQTAMRIAPRESFISRDFPEITWATPEAGRADLVLVEGVGGSFDESGTRDIALAAMRRVAEGGAMLVVDSPENIARIQKALGEGYAFEVSDLSGDMQRLMVREYARDLQMQSRDTLYQEDAWHGSQHYHERFTTDKIGTGEGMIAFGWGLYFTSRKDIGEYYSAANIVRDVGSMGLTAVKQRSVRQIWELLSERTQALVRSNSEGPPSLVGINRTMADLEVMRESADGRLAEVIDDDLRRLNDMLTEVGSREAKRNLYHVTLFDGKNPSEYALLSWYDKVPQELANRLADRLEESGFPKLSVWVGAESAIDNLTGEKLYIQLAKYMRRLDDTPMGGARRASLFLLDSGVDGITMPAQAMAGNRDFANGRNYVIFDESAVTIEERTLFQDGIEDDGRDQVMRAVEKGDYVRREVLEQWNKRDEPWAEYELFRREVLELEAVGYSSEDEFVDAMLEAEGGHYSEEYYRSVWADAEASRRAAPSREVDQSFLKAIDHEMLVSILDELAEMDVDRDLPLVLRPLMQKVREGKRVFKKDTAEALKAMSADAPKFRSLIESNLDRDNEIRSLLEEVRADVVAREREVTTDIQRGTTAQHVDERIKRYQVKIKVLEDALMSARSEARRGERDQRDRLIRQRIQSVKAARDEMRHYYKTKQEIEKKIRRMLRKPSKNINWKQAQQIQEIQYTLRARPSQRMERIRMVLRESNYRVTHEAMEQILKLELDRKNVRTLPIEELEQIYDQIERLREEGREEYRKRVESEKEIVRGARRAMVETLGDVGELVTVKGSREAQRRMSSSLPQKISFSTLRPERIARMLDGDQQKVFYDWLWKKTNEATNNELSQINRRLEAGQQELQRLGIRARDLGRRVTIDGYTFTNDEIISMYVGLQDEHSRDALRFGNRIPEYLMHRFIDRLSPEMKEWGDWMVSSFGGENFDRLAEVFVQDTNRPIKKVMRYFPMLRQEVYYDDLQQQVADDLLARSGAGPASVGKGFTISRIRISPKHQRPIRLGATQIWREQVTKQEHYISHGMLIKRMNSIFRDRMLQEALTKKYGDSAPRWVEKYIKDIAHPNIYDVHDTMRRTSQFLRQSLTLGALAFNPITALKQLPSFAFYLPYAGAPHLLVSLGRFMTNPIGMMKRVREMDPQVRNRAYSRIDEEIKTISRNRVMDARNKIGRVGMSMIRMMDAMAVTIGWDAVYQRAKHEGKSDQEAVELAQTATLITQPAARAKDLAQIYRSHEAYNWLLMFSNQLNQIWNMVTYDMFRGAPEGRSKLAHGFGVAFSVVLSSVVIGAIQRREPQDEPEEIGEDILSNLISAVPFIGSDVRSGMEGWFSTGVEPLPLASELGRFMAAMGDEDKDPSEHMERVGRLLYEAALTAGAPGIVPARRSYRAWVDELDREIDDAYDIWVLLTGGPQEDE